MALVASFLLIALRVYWWIIVTEVILSWIPRRPREPVFLSSVRDFVRAASDPYLDIFRKVLPTVGAGGVGLDLSPLIGLLVLSVLEGLVVRLAI